MKDKQFPPQDTTSMHYHRINSTEPGEPDTIFVSTNNRDGTMTLYLTPQHVIDIANTLLTDDERAKICAPVATEG